MVSAHKLFYAYGVGSKQYEAHKQNQNPSERRIQEVRGTTRIVLDCSGAPKWSWILCMTYAIAILNYRADG